MTMSNIRQEEFVLTLASSSPQRQRILQELGIVFSSVTSDVEEVMLPDAEDTVLTNAKLKVLEVAARPHTAQESVILGADTVLAGNNGVRGKPESYETAIRYLIELSDTEITAWTGVAVFSPTTDRGVVLTEHAVLRFNNFTIEAAEWYAQTGEPMVRAGALGTSLLGEIFIKEIQGAYSCVVGLPKCSTLLACSDNESLGDYRLNLPQSVLDMIGRRWNGKIVRFSGNGQWL